MKLKNKQSNGKEKGLISEEEFQQFRKKALGL